MFSSCHSRVSCINHLRNFQALAHHLCYVNEIQQAIMDHKEKPGLENATHEEEHAPSDSEVTHDATIMGDKEHDMNEAMQYGHLSEEELRLEKKLRLRIDLTIMPFVVVVGLA